MANTYFKTFVVESRRQYDSARKSFMNGGVKKTLRQVKDYAVNLPCVLLKTPEEWEQELLAKARADGTLRYVPSPYFKKTDTIEIIRPPVEPGTIRVKAYRRMGDVYFDSPMWDDLPVYPNGEFSIYHMRRYWGFQKIAAVDSVHVTPVWPDEYERLSPLAMRILMDNQECLRVVERTTPGRRFARRLRFVLKCLPRRLAMLAETGFFIGVGVLFALGTLAFMALSLCVMFFVSPPAIVRGFLTSPIGFLSTCIAVSFILAWLMSFLPDEIIHFKF